MNSLDLKTRSIQIRKQQCRAIANARRRLRRQLEDIVWRNTVLRDAIDDIDIQAAAGDLPEFNMKEADDIPRLPPAKRG